MTGLRARQKEDRHRRILEVARQQMRTNNYRDVTIEAIAEEAGISAMTVYNYYGSKGGLLLSLVAESDRHLIEKIDHILSTEFPDAKSALLKFSMTIFDHAFSYLDRQTWRYVLSTSIVKGDSSFGRGFAALERELVIQLSKLLLRLKEGNILARNFDAQTAAAVIYNVHNARFIVVSGS